jgi:hypothetical protein
MAKLLGTTFELETIALHVSRAFERSFGMGLVRISASSSRLQIANENL